MHEVLPLKEKQLILKDFHFNFTSRSKNLGPSPTYFDLLNRDLSVIGAEQPEQLKALILAQRY
jgi:hypothetical protein